MQPAVLTFQRTRGLPQTGDIDPATLQHVPHLGQQIIPGQPAPGLDGVPERNAPDRMHGQPGPGGPPGRGRPDPRDPNHPDHAMNQGVREQVRSLYAEHGVALTDQQLDCTTACVMADARRSGMTKVTALEFSEDYATGKPDLNGNLVAYQGDPNNPASKYSATETQRTANTQPDDAYRQFEQTTQERTQVQNQFLAQQEQINAQSQNGPVQTL